MDGGLRVRTRLLKESKSLGEQGMMQSVVRAFVLLPPPLWPGFHSRTCCYIWDKFVVSSRPYGFLLGSPVFLAPQNPSFQILILIWLGIINKKSHLVECSLLKPIIIIKSFLLAFQFDRWAVTPSCFSRASLNLLHFQGRVGADVVFFQDFSC